jgi:hypothetical protein
MTTGNSAPRTRTKRGLLRAFAVITAAVVGMIGLVATPAFASQTCTGQTRSNVCLAIWQLDNGNYLVHVGIDYHISQSDAQAIIDQPGDPFFTVAMSGSTSLFFIPETDIGASAESGLSADFDVTVLPAQLGGRTVFARLWLTDNRVGTQTFNSPSLSPPY